MNSEQPAGLPNPIFQSATEAFLGDSDTPIPVRVGHLDEGVPTLSREEFKKASLRQRQLDAEAEAQAKNPRSAPTGTPVQPPPLKVAGARPSGKPSRARRTTSPPVFDGTIIPQVDQIAKTNAAFEVRIARMEAGQALLTRGVDRLVELLAARDERAAAVETREDVAVQEDERPAAHGKPDLDADQEFADSIPDEDDNLAALEDDELTLGDDVGVTADSSPSGEEWEPGDPNIARMQAHIQRKTPLKDFRRFWQSLCPRAGYQEWPAEMQARFTNIFSTIILHPKFLVQVRRTVLTFHNGQCMGEEQMYKALVMLAGCCSLYSIITAEV